MARKRVMIADYHPLIHKAIRECLNDSSDFEYVASAFSGSQVRALVARTGPELVLLDLHLPDIDGLDCLAVLREEFPHVTALIFSGVEDAETIQRVLRAGAAAFVAKSVDPIDLPSVLRLALQRKAYFSVPQVGCVAQEITQYQAHDQMGLTSRELEILAAVSRGLSNRAVGKELFLSDQTVKFHLHNIYGKLGVANRTEASAAAHRLGLTPDAAIAAGY
jgi:DNA-binding NarL/FixJ family response regulator